MSSFFKFFVLLFLSTLVVFSQNTTPFRFRDYPLVQNLDSLEKNVLTLKNKPGQYLHGLITLERSFLAVNPNKFGHYMNTIEALAKQQRSNLAMAMYQFMKARTIRKDDLATSAKLGLAAISYFESQKDTTGMLRCYSHMLDVNTNDITGKDAKNFKYYYDKLTALGQKSTDAGDKLLSARDILIYGLNFNGDKSLQIAENTFKESMRLIDKNPQYDYLKTSFYGNMGAVYVEFNELQKALVWFLKLYQMKDNSRSAMTNYNVAELYYELKDYKNAEIYIRKALVYYNIEKEENTVFLVKLHEVMADILYKSKRYEEAWISRNIQDSLKRINEKKLQTASFLDLQTKYQTEKKEAENRLLLQKEQLVESRNSLYIWLLVVGSITLLVVSGLAYLLYKSNAKQRQLIYFHDQLFTIIAHDMRSPMTAFEGISTEVAFLLRKGEYDTIKALSNSMDDAIVRTNLLLNNLLEWALTQNPKLSTLKTSLSVYELAKDTQQLYKAVAKGHESVIEIDIPESLHIWAERNEMQLVFRNLLDNALKHSTTREVLIKARMEKKDVVIEVKNDGFVIPDKLSKLQQQLTYQPEIVQRGGGLGLYLVSLFVKKHNGKLSLQSSEKDGTIFTVRIPQ